MDPSYRNALFCDPPHPDRTHAPTGLPLPLIRPSDRQARLQALALSVQGDPFAWLQHQDNPPRTLFCALGVGETAPAARVLETVRAIHLVDLGQTMLKG